MTSLIRRSVVFDKSGDFEVAVMAEVELYDSTICRLCAADNSAGIQLYEENQYSSDLSGLINRYLPLKVIKNLFQFGNTFFSILFIFVFKSDFF